MWLEAAFSEQGSARIYCKNMHAHVQQISMLPLLPLYLFLKTQILSWVSIVKDSIVEELTLVQQAIGKCCFVLQEIRQVHRLHRLHRVDPKNISSKSA